MIVERFSREDWAGLAEATHATTFGEYIPKENLRIDFAIAGVHENQIIGWATCRETDHETLYWQYGGSIYDNRASIHVYRAWTAMLDYCLKRYKRVHMLIENTNHAMLRLANKTGLLISGVRVFNGAILVEHGIERG
jgi:hypothetical protein